MPLYLTEEDVRGLVTMRDVVAVVEAAFTEWGHGGTANLPRRRLPLPGGQLNVMAAVLPAENVFCHRSYSYRPVGNHNLLELFELASGRLLAVIECTTLSTMRTGAATAVAARHLARADATSVALVGAGRQAAAQLEALAVVRPIRGIAVFGRDPDGRRRFAEAMHEKLDLSVTASESVEACLDGADLVVTATTSATPVLLGRWLEPGMHVTAMGANDAGRRELDDEAVLRADRLVTDDGDQARLEAAEFIALTAADRLRWTDIDELGLVVQGRAPGRTEARQITVFKSLGLALQDAATAALVYRRARERGIGKSF